jgi:hypothetical protein
MIQKFRDLMKVTQNLEKVDNNLNVLHEEVAFLKRNFDDIKGSVDKILDVVNETTKTQERMLRNFNKNLVEISTIKEKFKEELFNFKLLKNQTQKEIMEKFSEEIEKEIEQRKEDIKIDSGNYKEIKESIEGFAMGLASARAEIAKWTEISGKIKAEDFELTKFTNKIKSIEDEKLELMQKVDSLERLLSKMRRNQR